MNPYIIPGIRRKKHSQEERIIRKVCEHYKIESLSENCWARQVAGWVMRKRVKLSYEKIAKLCVTNVGSVRHGIKEVGNRMQCYEETRVEIRELIDKIYP